MKFALTFILAVGSTVAFAQEMKNFNKVLIQNVQHDLEADNVQSFKKNSAPMRGPASVQIESADKNFQENSKLEKKERQLGNSKW